MSKTKLILIRHGQSIGNLNRVYLGHTDWDLSELGYQQADLVCDFLKNEKIDAVYSSDLMRAYNTVLPIANQRGLSIIKNKNLREIFAGEWEGKHYEELVSEYEKPYHIWKTDIGNAGCTGGETVIVLQKRIFDEIRKIAEENMGKTVCIGTHATPIRTLNAAVNNISKDEMYQIPWATNASVTVLEYNNCKFTMLKYGEDAFLGDAITVFGRNI